MEVFDTLKEEIKENQIHAKKRTPDPRKHVEKFIKAPSHNQQAIKTKERAIRETTVIIRSAMINEDMQRCSSIHPYNQHSSFLKCFSGVRIAIQINVIYYNLYLTPTSPSLIPFSCSFYNSHILLPLGDLLVLSSHSTGIL